MKYTINKDQNSPDNSEAIAQSLLWIANELAEANRLKRIELNYKGLPSPELQDKVEVARLE